MKLLKITVLILCMAFIVMQLFACDNPGKSQNDSDNSKTTTDDQLDGENPEDSQNNEIDSRLDVSDGLPEADFGNSAFTVLYPDWAAYQTYLVAEEDNGDLMNDVVYYRQKHVEDRFNIQMKWVKIEDQSLPNLKNSVKSGIHEYDLALTMYSNSIDTFAADNYVLDWNTVPNVDFSKPWWNTNSNDTLSLNGKVFFAVSDFIIPEPNVTFFNKDMIQSYGLEDPYKIVRDGKWTYDKMYEMGKVVAKDLDGDGLWTDKDQYGLVTQLNWYFYSVPQSAGINLVEKDGEGRLVLTTAVERLHEALISVDRLVNDKSVTFTYPYGAMGDQYISALPLSSGQVLFHWDPLAQAFRYRAIDAFDYGILPWPKLDDEQESYRHFSHNGFIVVPTTNPDLAKTGIIVEALSAESYKYCVPAYNEVLLGIKLTRDQDSVEMLNLIYSTCVFDIGRNYLGGDPMQTGFRDLLEKGSTDYISFYEKNAAKTQARLDKLYDAIMAQ
ncbi:MAG: hypothetical protein FWF92_08960 [Oscillospiraceae bacterium]|nr:hypothetical protein [Oscillospiraceae bacterium]